MIELEAAQSVFINAKIHQFPHCDPKVLHEPKACEVCDMYPDWQALRLVWGICFSGKLELNKMPDPATYARGLSWAEWYGNRASPVLDLEEELEFNSEMNLDLDSGGE